MLPAYRTDSAELAIPTFDIVPSEVEGCIMEFGMAYYEGRKYPGWHHHMLTTMLAPFFLWYLKLHVGEKKLPR